jgi:hypothetical protein
VLMKFDVAKDGYTAHVRNVLDEGIVRSMCLPKLGTGLDKNVLVEKGSQ